MKNLILVLLLWVCSPSVASAAEPVKDPPPPVVDVADVAPRRKVMDLEGTRGVWFRQDVVDEIMKQAELLKEHEKALAKAESALASQEEVTAACREVVVFSDAIADKAQANLERSIRRAREATEDRDAFTSGQPATWVLIGTVGALVIAVVVDKIQEAK
jgi:hypothetical protein